VEDHERREATDLHGESEPQDAERIVGKIEDREPELWPASPAWAGRRRLPDQLIADVRKAILGCSFGQA
jgi:hypothetical protein